MLAIAALVRRCAAFRVVLLLLAVSSSSPVQLVLCQENGAAPRVEQALNGQCLSFSRPQCGNCIQHESTSESSPEPQAGRVANNSCQNHCDDCTDQVIGMKHALRHANLDLSYNFRYIDAPLISFALTGMQLDPDCRRPEFTTKSPCLIPTLTIVHARVTRLII